MLKSIALAAPVTRSPATAVKLSQVLLSFAVLTDKGAVALQWVVAVEDRLSPGCLAEMQALAATEAAAQVQAAEAAPPTPAPAPITKP